MKRPKYSVLIPDAESGHALIVARCLAAAGARICVLARQPRTSLRYSRRVTYFKLQPGGCQASETFSLPFILEQLATSRADIFLPVDEPAHAFTIEHRRELSAVTRLPPLCTVESFHTAVHKDRLASFLRAQHIPTPRTIPVPAGAEPDEMTEQVQAALRFPLIAKPAYGNGGRGIVAIRTADDLRQFMMGHFRTARGDYVIQEIIRGYDIDLSALCVDGEIKAYTIQRGVVARNRQFAAAAGVEFLQSRQLLAVAEQMFRSLNFSGIAHVDARFDEDRQEYKIIEVNARYWGSLVASLNAGINFPDLACRLGLGERISRPPYENTRFIDYVSYGKRLIRNPMAAGTRPAFRLSETDIGHLFADPVAELVNVIKRRT